MNKKRIDAHNNDLSAILDQITDLPLKSLVEAMASAGEYVWETYDYSSDGTVSDFIEYVVSDDPSAYPEEGAKNGKWYKKITSSISPDDLGISKFEHGVFTVDADTNSVAINHNLGQHPRLLILMVDAEFSYTSLTYYVECAIAKSGIVPSTPGHFYGGGLYGNRALSDEGSMIFHLTGSESDTRIYGLMLAKSRNGNELNAYFKKGSTVKWILGV